MAIGNAPWPIGVTMVGIHARTGREKIFSKHVAHVLVSYLICFVFLFDSLIANVNLFNSLE